MCYLCDRLKVTHEQMLKDKPPHRYAVTSLGFGDMPDQEKVVGWTSNPSGGSLVAMVNSHPSWHSPRVYDTEDQALTNIAAEWERVRQHAKKYS